MGDQIESLALQKEFSDLNPVEKARVLAEMSEPEYHQLRAVLLTVRQMDADLTPPARMRERLLEKMSGQVRPGFMTRLVRVRVPAWLAAAAVVILGWALMERRDIAAPITPAPQTIVRVDTVYREKIILRNLVQWRERIVYEKVPEKPILTPAPAIDSLPVALEYLGTPDFTPAHIGTSLNDTPELMDFFTQGDK